MAVVYVLTTRSPTSPSYTTSVDSSEAERGFRWINVQSMGVGRTRPKREQERQGVIQGTVGDFVEQFQ